MALRHGLDSLIVAASGTADGGQLALAAYSRVGGPALTDELLDWAQRLADELARFWDDQAQLERNLRLSRYRDAHRTIQRALLDHPEPSAIYLTLANTLIDEAAATAVVVYVPDGDTLRRVVSVGHVAEALGLLPEPPVRSLEPTPPAPTEAWMGSRPVVRLRPSLHPDVSTEGPAEALAGMAAIGCWPVFSGLPVEPGVETRAAAVLLLAAAEIDAFDADMRRLLDEIADTVGLALRQYNHHLALSLEQERQTYLALHDALTDLPNRRALDYHLERALARAARHQHLVAVGMLVLSPISGILADRYGSRLLATLGMLVTGLGLAGLLFIAVDTPYWQLAGWQLVIGAGAGIFNSPNTSAVMGVVPPSKRGIGAGMRSMLTNTGFIISIALAIGLISGAMDPKVMVAVFAGTQTGSSGIDLQPFIDALHIAFGAGVIASVVGAVISALRGEHRSWEETAAAEAFVRNAGSGLES